MAWIIRLRAIAAAADHENMWFLADAAAGHAPSLARTH
jgi:hypothetical protein